MRKLNYNDAGITGLIGCCLVGVCIIIVEHFGVNNVPEIIRFGVLMILIISVLLLYIWVWCVLNNIERRIFERCKEVCYE